MSRTKRFYNKNKKYWKELSHPYKVICMGNCRTCKNWSSKGKDKERKTTIKHDIIKFYDLTSPIITQISC